MSCLLFIDTSGKIATVALAKDGHILNYTTYDDPIQQASLLNTWIEGALKNTALSLENLDGICVCAGPGSYTGLRVGLSTVKGIAYSLEKKIMLFDRLGLIAGSFLQGNSEKAVLLKAREKEYFFGYFDTEGNAIIHPRHLKQEELAGLYPAFSEHAIVLTDDDTLVIEGRKVKFSPTFSINPDIWLQMAMQRFQEGMWDDLAYSEPFYLKAAFVTTAKNKLII